MDCWGLKISSCVLCMAIRHSRILCALLIRERNMYLYPHDILYLLMACSIKKVSSSITRISYLYFIPQTIIFLFFFPLCGFLATCEIQLVLNQLHIRGFNILVEH